MAMASTTARTRRLLTVSRPDCHARFSPAPSTGGLLLGQVELPGEYDTPSGADRSMPAVSTRTQSRALPLRPARERRSMVAAKAAGSTSSHRL